jgi:branched-subunit amino acid transport protein
MRDWLVLVACGLGTYALRACMLLVVGDSPIPEPLARASRYVAPAVLAAIAIPGLVAPQGAVSLQTTVPALAAGAAVVLLARRTASLTTPLVAGLAMWWAVSATLSVLLPGG